MVYTSESLLIFITFLTDGIELGSQLGQFRHEVKFSSVFLNGTPSGFSTQYI